MDAVPQHYLGLWQRRLLSTAGGIDDTTTAVYWLQTNYLFADIRVPLGTEDGALSRAMQAGFAGITEVEGDLCQWHRLIDFQPPSLSDDIGRMHFVAPDYLREEGLDSSYHEIWERLPASVGRNQGVWLTSCDGRQGCLVIAGDYFLFAAGRTQSLPAGESLQALLGSGADESVLDFELSLGRHQLGTNPWQIELSTLPKRAGQVLLPAQIDPDSLLKGLSPQLLSHLGAYPPAQPWVVSTLPHIQRS